MIVTTPALKEPYTLTNVCHKLRRVPSSGPSTHVDPPLVPLAVMQRLSTLWPPTREAAGSGYLIKPFKIRGTSRPLHGDPLTSVLCLANLPPCCLLPDPTPEAGETEGSREKRGCCKATYLRVTTAGESRSPPGEADAVWHTRADPAWEAVAACLTCGRACVSPDLPAVFSPPPAKSFRAV